MFRLNKSIFSSLFLLCLLSPLAARGKTPESPYLVTYTVVDSEMIPEIPEEYKHFQWHRFETPNFEILAINRSQGVELLNRCEPLKTWVQERWGLQDVPYRHKCMVLCVPTQEIFKKWFRRPDVDPKIAKSKQPNGSDREVYAIWIAGESGYLYDKLPEKIGRVSLLNYEETYNIKIGYWAHVGMSSLNNHVTSIRKLLGSLDPNETYESKAIFERTSQVVGKRLNEQEYRARAAALCLLLRKQQYGGTRFIGFLSATSLGSDKTLEQSLVKVYGWGGYADFDNSYGRYVRNLSYDIRVGRTPDIGLTWFVPKKGHGDSK